MAEFLAELLGVRWWLGRERVRRIWERSKVVGVERKRRKRGGHAVWSLSGVDEHAGGSSTSWRARAAKQLRGLAHGGAGRSGSAPAAEHPPLLEHCSEPYPTIVCFCKIRPNFELKTIAPKQKLCRNLQTTKHVLIPKTYSKWKSVNLAKQFELQISI